MENLFGWKPPFVFLAVLLCAPLLFAQSSPHNQRQPAKPLLVPDAHSVAAAKYLASQLAKCNDGVGASCYNYGYALSQREDPKEKARGEKFVRRACTLAYAPACGRNSSADPTEDQEQSASESGSSAEKAVANCFGEGTRKALMPAGNSGQLLTRMDKGSVWERAGLLPGDVIKSVNGQPLKSTDQVAAALAKGNANIEVDRNGMPVSLSLSCPH